MKSHGQRGQLTGLCSPWLEWVRLREVLPHLPQDASVLDIGCGRGRLLAWRRPVKYMGLDVIPAVIAHSRILYPDHEFHALDVESEDLARFGRFEILLLLAVIEHFTDPEAVLRKLTTHLAPAGRILMTTPHPRAARFLAAGAWLGLCSAESEEEHHGYLDRQALDRLANHCSLRLCEYHTFLLGLNQFAMFRHSDPDNLRGQEKSD